MAGYLGEKLGEGLYADVHVWAPGQVVKLFKADVPARISWWEARLTRAVFAAGGPAPEVLDEVTVAGRFGVVMPRLDGPTLRALSRSGADTIGTGGRDSRDPRPVGPPDAAACQRPQAPRRAGRQPASF